MKKKKTKNISTKISQKNIYILYSFFLFLFVISFLSDTYFSIENISAQTNLLSGAESPVGFDFKQVIAKIMTSAVNISIVVTSGYMLYGGYQYIIHGGDKADQSKKIIKYSIVGFMIVMLSFSIQKFFKEIVGA